MTCLVHDTLASELASLNDLEARVRQTQADLGALYSEHPVVVENPQDKYVPVAFYQDGVAFQWDRQDGCIGFWVINLVTQRKHLALVCKKSLKCRCGCRGWCSYHACYSFLAWLFKVMREGIYLAERSDGTGWGGTRWQA